MTTVTVSTRTRYLFDPPDEKMQSLEAGIRMVCESALPYLRDFTTDERKSQSRLGADAEVFLADGQRFVQSHPQFGPGYVDIPRFNRTMASIDALETQLQPLLEVVRFMQDSLISMRTDAYGDVRAYYRSVKVAAELGEPGAEPIALQLGKMYANNGPKSSADEEPAPEGPPAPAPLPPAPTA